MAKSATPVCDLIERLLSAQMSTADMLATARDAEAAITTARASTQADRKRWAEQKARQRGGGGQMSTPDDSVAIGSSCFGNGTNDSGKKEKAADGVHVDKPARSKGARIPDDWCPSEDDVTYGTDKLTLTPAEVSGLGEDMKLWAQANANRAVARKADWGLTFKGWMRREAPKVIRNRPRGGGGGANGQAAAHASGARTGFSGIAAQLRQRVEADIPFEQPPGGPQGFHRR